MSVGSGGHGIVVVTDRVLVDYLLTGKAGHDWGEETERRKGVSIFQ